MFIRSQSKEQECDDLKKKVYMYNVAGRVCEKEQLYKH
jgi:hypothetical protein